jgi:hypothetical protein
MQTMTITCRDYMRFLGLLIVLVLIGEPLPDLLPLATYSLIQ